MNYCKDFIIDRFQQLKTTIESKKIIKDVIGLLAKGASVADANANGDNALHMAVQVVCFGYLATTALTQSSVLRTNFMKIIVVTQ